MITFKQLTRTLSSMHCAVRELLASSMLQAPHVIIPKHPSLLVLTAEFRLCSRASSKLRQVCNKFECSSKTIMLPTKGTNV